MEDRGIKPSHIEWESIPWTALSRPVGLSFLLAFNKMPSFDHVLAQSSSQRCYIRHDDDDDIERQAADDTTIPLTVTCPETPYLSLDDDDDEPLYIRMEYWWSLFERAVIPVTIVLVLVVIGIAHCLHVVAP